jgi:TonB family protein
MKLIMSFFFLISGLLVFGQSAKKLNEELRLQLNSAKAESDSIKRVITQRKTNLESTWLILKNNEFATITEHGKVDRLLKYNIGFLYDVLDRLGDNPQKLIDKQQIKETRIPLAETENVYRSYSYLFPPKLNILAIRVPDTLVLDKYKVKLESELIQKVLIQYADARRQNLQLIATLTEYEKSMQGFKLETESIYQQSNAAYDRLWNAYSTLMERYSKLNADYLAKGPKAFPPIYKEEFEKAADMGYPKQIDRVVPGKKSVSSKTLRPEQDRKEILIESKSEPNGFVSVDIPAEFPGGRAAMLAYLSENMIMPDKVKAQGITGKCYLKFIVLESGEISDVKVVRGVPDCPECDAEAIRVVDNMPNWIPSKSNDKVVKSYFNLPIVFKAQ